MYISYIVADRKFHSYVIWFTGIDTILLMLHDKNAYQS